jgi:hypothetical protein
MDGSSAGGGPAFTELGLGYYHFTYDTTALSKDVIGSLDAGASIALAAERYKLVYLATTDAAQKLLASFAVIAAPAGPTVCRMFLDCVDFAGAALVGVRVTVENLYQTPVQSLAMVRSTQAYVSDAVGRVEFDVLRGAQVKVSIGNTPIAKQITVPNVASASLLTLMGSPQDSFTVVPA